MDLCHVWEGFPYLMPTNDLGAVDAALVVGAHQLPQVDQMVEQGAWEVHENGLQERGRNTQLQLLVLIGGCEQEVVALMQSLLEEPIVFEGVSLELHHLLKVADAAMRHLCRLARSSRCKIIGVNNSALKSSTGGI